MLLEFSCSNHRSIRNEVLFSSLAGQDDTFYDRTHKIAGVRVLNCAVIYGANGSGKSNFIHAVLFVRNLVVNSMKHQSGQGIYQCPHKLEGFDKESTYKIQFIVKGIRYAYGFSLKNMIVADEYLYCFPNKRQRKIFERSENGFTEGSKFRGKFSSCKNVLKPNRLMLSCAANFSSVQEVVDAFNFFNDELVVYTPGMQANWMNYSLYQMNSNLRMKAAVLEFLRELGTGITDIRVSIDQRKLESSEIPPFLSEEFKTFLLRESFDAIQATVIYDNFEVDLTEESAGVKKLFGLLCPLIDIMINGKVLLCDELESNLHESFVYGLVKLFITAKTEHFAQMIFTTQDTGLLDPHLFRRDQIWFAEMKRDERSTGLYSLAEIRNVKAEENFERGYTAGKYGAIPMLNLNSAKIFSQM